MYRNYGAPFTKPLNQDHEGEDHSHERSEKSQAILDQRAANLAEIKKAREARYNNTGENRTAIFDRFYDHPGEAIALLGAAPLAAGIAGVAGIAHAPTAANFGYAMLAGETTIAGAAAGDSLKNTADRNKKNNKGK